MSKEWTIDDINSEEARRLFIQTQNFRRSMLQYKCALMEVETKFRVLDAEFSIHHDRNPIESIKSRLKDPVSLINKVIRKDLPLSLDAIEEYIWDIAGVRIICSFEEDVYYLAECFLAQNDVELLTRKDYIKDPKPNGYRSLHLTIRIPVFFAEEVRYVPVEIQFRTIAMDFWASLEHTIRYKKDLVENDFISRELLACASSSRELDEKMGQIIRLVEEARESKDAGDEDPGEGVSDEL